MPWQLDMLAPERVWPFGNGSGQRVAVLGSGVADHPLLTGSVQARTDLAPDEQGGRDSGRQDCLGTGTGVAGIIAGSPSDQFGFHGVAPGAGILSAKLVGDRYPTGSAPRDAVPANIVASGIDWAIQQNATVIAVAAITYQDSAELADAVRRARERDILMLAAVGDSSRDDPPGTTPYPAAYPEVMGIGSVDKQARATDSSRPGEIDLVAPGAEVLTTYPGDGLGQASGTAFATGYAAGAAALVRSHRPGLSESDVRARLLATATPAPEGTGSSRYGHGLVNPYHATHDRMAAGQAAELRPMTRASITARERAEATERQRTDALAYTVAGGGLLAAALLIAVLVFGPRGRRRRWRPGLAATPSEASREHSPDVPVDLFGDRKGTNTQSRNR